MSIRQQNDPAFPTFLDSIGGDYEHETVELGRLHHTRSVQFVFPPAIVSDPVVCIAHAILRPYNAFVNEFTMSILNNVPRISHCSIEEDVQGSNEAVYEDPDFLNSLQEPGIPPHELVLKVGAICRFTSSYWPASTPFVEFNSSFLYTIT
jgi:hypothetical protein